MYRVLNEIHPSCILELGLGQSTRMTAQYAASHEGVTHYVVESQPAWIDFFKRSFQVSPATQMVHLDCVFEEYKGEQVRVYEHFAEQFGDKQFDFIIIDAPLGGDMHKYSRIDVLRLLPGILKQRFVLLADDAQRKTESCMIGAMVGVLKENKIEYEFGRYRGEKECDLICSPDVGFLRTM